MNIEPCMVKEATGLLEVLEPDNLVLSDITEQNTCALMIRNDHNNPVGVAGVTVQGGGVGTVWTGFTPGVRGHPLQVTRRVRKLLDQQMKMLDLHRIQITVAVEDTETQRWARLLGFHAECILFHYRGQDGHSFLYVKFSEDISWHPPSLT